MIRAGLVANSVLLSIALVVTTAFAVASVIVQAVGRQVEQAADRRLVDGATLFRASLDDAREDLLAVGDWLARDPELAVAVQENRPGEVQERLAFALRLNAVDEALVADANGAIVGRVRVGEPPDRGGDIPRGPGFHRALAGRTAYGIARGGQESLRQEMYVPLRPPAGERPNAVLRLASFLDEKDLDRFRTRTDLEASLFFGEARLVTTLRQPDGKPLREVGPEPAIYREVVGEGREFPAWRDLPIGRLRSYYVPLNGPEGDRVGMLSVAVPVNTLQGELREVLLPALPVTLGIILVGAAFAYLLARRVREPVLLLAAAAARLREGDLSTPIPSVREPELAPLAEQLEMARSSVKRSLEAAADERSRLRAIFAALREPIITSSPGGHITGFNTAAAALFGDPGRLHGSTLQELLPFLALLSPEGGLATRWQGRIAGASGRALDLEVSRTSLAEGQLPAIDVYVLHDVSRHAELSRFREQLLYNVAHELRGPLAVLENALEILAAEYGELSAREFDQLISSSRRTAARLRTLMEDLLSAGSIQSGRFQVRLRPTALGLIVDDALDIVQAMIAGRGQRVEHRMQEEALHVLADERYLRQVLSNLLANASKYSPDDTVLWVQAERVDGQVRVTVRDSGPGIPTDQRAGLFERFYRARAGHEEPGIGLGLAIAKGIVEAHGGSIGVESELGAGTSVWFTLSAAQEPTE